MIWLGNRWGNLSDWVTQQWVRVTGKRLDLAENSWLDGQVGNTSRIGEDFFERYAAEKNLTITLWLWRKRFLRLHYRMKKRTAHDARHVTVRSATS